VCSDERANVFPAIYMITHPSSDRPAIAPDHVYL
jgi:hypothetical protein